MCLRFAASAFEVLWFGGDQSVVDPVSALADDLQPFSVLVGAHGDRFAHELEYVGDTAVVIFELDRAVEAEGTGGGDYPVVN